jgi:hypothetical protein
VRPIQKTRDADRGHLPERRMGDTPLRAAHDFPHPRTWPRTGFVVRRASLTPGLFPAPLDSNSARDLNSRSLFLGPTKRNRIVSSRLGRSLFLKSQLLGCASAGIAEDAGSPSTIQWSCPPDLRTSLARNSTSGSLALPSSRACGPSVASILAVFAIHRRFRSDSCRPSGA